MKKSEPTFAILVIIDLANSTKWMEKVGDRKAAQTMRLYDRIFRGLLIKHSGIEIDKTDGALLLFNSIKNAIYYSMEYHKLVEKHLGLLSRVAIHTGTVMMHSNASIWVARGAKPIEVEGIHKSICARVCSLCDPGQTLLTKRTAQVAQAHSSSVRGLLVKYMGEYSFKGVKTPMEIYGVALRGQASRLLPPSNKEKAKLFRHPPLTKKQKWMRAFKRYVLPYLFIHYLRAIFIIISILQYGEMFPGVGAKGLMYIDSILEFIHSLPRIEYWQGIWEKVEWAFKK